MIVSNIQSNLNFIFGYSVVARKLILNGGAIRPTGLLFRSIGYNAETFFIIIQVSVHKGGCKTFNKSKCGQTGTCYASELRSLNRHTPAVFDIYI